MLDRVTPHYADRSPIVRMRAQAMLVVFAAGAVVAAVMAGHDLLFAGENLVGHLLAEVVLMGLMAAMVALLLRGREDLAANGVVVLAVAFHGLSLADAWGDNPAGFYSGFAMWAPVFIVIAMLFASPLLAGVVTALAIAWNGVYWVLFCQDLPAEARDAALGEVLELGTIDAIVGVVGILGLVMVRTSMERAELELERNRRLTEELELRVLDRTKALDVALAERQVVLENLTDGLIAVGADGRRVELVNRAFLQMFGHVAQLEGTDIAEHLAPDVVQGLVAAWGTEDQVTADVALPDGRVGQLVAQRFGADDGRPIGVAALVRDVSLEREVDRMKTDFISMASHELRTPMTSVLGFAKIIRTQLERRVFPHVPEDDARGQKAVEKVRGNVEVILTEGERLTTLINDILDISKMEAGRVEYREEPVDVAALVGAARDAVASLFEGDPVLVVQVEDDLPIPTGDPHRLQQVLVNLLSNAQKFTETGTITLAARRVDRGVELSVTDTGAGIAPEDQEAVFERFKQVGDTLTDKPKGTGLGLAICQAIVQAHGSRIRVESKVGEGSRFWFVLAVG